MKFYGQKLNDFLKSKNANKQFLLVYGSDAGLVHECIKKIINTFILSSNKSDCISRFTGPELKNEPEKLWSSAHSLSLFNEQQVIVISEASNTLTESIKYLITNKEKSWPIIIEAGELNPQSSLRQLFEKNDTCAAIACYPDEGAQLHRVFRETLNGFNLAAPDNVISYLEYLLGGDRLLIKKELVKLSLFLNPSNKKNQVINIEDVQKCVVNSSIESLEKLIFATGSGNQYNVDYLMTKYFANDTNPLKLIRALQKHFQRLHFVRLKLDEGEKLENITKLLKPPIFFKWKETFKNQTKIWSVPKLNKVLKLLIDCEIQCKTTGMPSTFLCMHLLLKISQGAKLS